ncbi:MAG: DUF169 domain-containing protein [Selenomonadaceae bacterium]|nr:DUF169 domain-containing protein [Selenomonadaceae bacterium]
MESKISKLIKLSNSPVAVVQADTCSEKVLQFKENRWGCVIAMLAAAANGKIAAFSKETTPCLGGRAGLGFEKYPLGWIEYFLSNGGAGIERCERYKKNPDLAREFICGISNALIEKLPPRKKFLLFKPLKFVEDETPEAIIFLVNADQLSGLVTLANYDSPRNDGVKILFGAGCAQTILYPMSEKNFCFVGLTDPSARKFLDKNLLAFGMSYEKFLQLEEIAEESFLTADAWQKIFKRI